MIYELFSKRRKKVDQSGSVDVYQYTQVSQKLRVQIQQILRDAVGPHVREDPYGLERYAHNPYAWNNIHGVLCRELGQHRLTSQKYDLAAEGVLNYIGTAEIEDFIDALEVCCRVIEIIIGPQNPYQRDELGIKQAPEDALAEINYRLREAGLGFAYHNGQVFRLDSEYTHHEVLIPALMILRGKQFSGAQQEFLTAHRHFRAGEYPQAITEAAKSFESTLKAVCDLKGWSYGTGARASDLLKRVRAEGLWPDFLDASFDQLIATLSSGLPKVRNEQGAHGQGSVVQKVPEYIAAYALHLAAAKIRLIADAADAA